MNFIDDAVGYARNLADNWAEEHNSPLLAEQLTMKMQAFFKEDQNGNPVAYGALGPELEFLETSMYHGSTNELVPSSYYQALSYNQRVPADFVRMEDYALTAAAVHKAWGSYPPKPLTIDIWDIDAEYSADSTRPLPETSGKYFLAVVPLAFTDGTYRNTQYNMSFKIFLMYKNGDVLRVLAHGTTDRTSPRANALDESLLSSWQNYRHAGFTNLDPEDWLFTSAWSSWFKVSPVFEQIENMAFYHVLKEHGFLSLDTRRISTTDDLENWTEHRIQRQSSTTDISPFFNKKWAFQLGQLANIATSWLMTTVLEAEKPTPWNGSENAKEALSYINALALTAMRNWKQSYADSNFYQRPTCFSNSAVAQHSPLSQTRWENFSPNIPALVVSTDTDMASWVLAGPGYVELVHNHMAEQTGIRVPHRLRMFIYNDADLVMVCASCQDYWLEWSGDIDYYDSVDEYRCQDCAPSDDYEYDDDEYRDSNGLIQFYSFTPELTFWKTPEDMPVKGAKEPLFLGIELEVEVENIRVTEAAKSFLSLTNQDTPTTPYFYLKEDSSINYGFEICTHPMTPNWIKTKFPFEAFNTMTEKGFFASESETCGQHIHVNRAAFTKAHLMKFLYFHEKMANQCGLVGGRGTHHHYSNLNETKYFLEGRKRQIIEAAGQTYHRGGIGFNKRDTIELRYPAGIVTEENIRKNVEWVELIFEFTRLLTVKDVQKLDDSGYLLFFAQAKKDKYPRVAKLLLESIPNLKPISALETN